MKQTSELSRYPIKSSAYKSNRNLLSGAVIILLGLAVWSVLGNSSAQQNKEVTRLLALLENANGDAKTETIGQLGEMGSDARAALPRLVALAVEQEVGIDEIPDSAATRAIEKIDIDAAIPLIEEKLFSDNTKWMAASLIEKYSHRPVANNVVLSLVKAMREIVNAQNSKEQSACFQCANALGRIEPKGVLALKRELFHDHESVRAAAVRGVPDGKAGKPFVLRLTLRLFDSSITVRRLTVKSLSDIGPFASDALTALKKHLSFERDPNEQANIRKAIEIISAQNRG